ncbi:MAG: hypothetical protein IH595_13085 [Bacteroidales bacterium]|nr:hypothetical protein [Bacteroidales bacterium]
MKVELLNKIGSLFFATILIFLWGCGVKNTQSNQLKEGDLLFQNIQCGPLCNAIEAVTQGVDGKKFSHCALVVKINDTLKVVEAIGKEVQVNSLKTFFARTGDTGFIHNITVERLKKPYRLLIPGAQDFALEQVGQPYDDDFLMNNGKWYCSELIYAAFKSANDDKTFFPLKPMTFKNPKTHQFFPAWVDYYKALNEPIPQGKPGINPGLISRSTKLQIIPVKRINWNKGNSE